MAWKFNLLKDMEDPSKIIFSDAFITVIEDAYPKAEKHFLVLPQRNISNLTQLRWSDLQLLEHMDQIGREIAERFGEGRVFKLGYHADPSMERLHLHVISDDLNSPSLKTMRHWNNFTTPMFIKSSEVIEDLRQFGRVRITSRAAIERYLQTPLKCHKCDYQAYNMPDLKNHILIHLGRYRYPYHY